MPPKKGKKKTKEELEAEELEKIALKAERQRLQEIENKKYRIKTLDTGVKQVLTMYCIENAWEHDRPKAYLEQFIIRQLKTMNVIANFSLIDLEIITEFNLYNLVFAKQFLKLDDKKTGILINLFFSVLRNNNDNYFFKTNRIGRQDIQSNEYLFSLYQEESEEFIKENNKLQLREKTLLSDLNYFSDLIEDHCVKNYFTPLQAKKMVEYLKSTYFKHFNLYKYSGESKQKVQIDQQNVTIDDIKQMEPLGLFEEDYVKQESVTEISVIETDKDEGETHEIEEEQVVESDLDEYDKLDPDIRSMIDAKILETKEIMQRELEERKAYLEEKLEELLNPKLKTKATKKKK